MVNYIRFLLCALACVLSVTSFAANDLDKWNSPEGRQVRTALKNKTTPTTTYREKPNVVDAEYRSSSNGGKILHRIEHATTESGSKKGVTIEALKQVDKSAVAKKWANQIFKGGVRFTAGAVLVEVAMQEMLDGLGWIMDEGAKIQRPVELDPNDEAYAKYTSPYMWKATHSKYTGGYNYSLENACRNYLAFLKSQSGSSSTYVSSTGNSCFYNENGSDWSTTLSRVTNSNYNPSAVPPAHEEVAQLEVEQKIADYLNTSPNTSKDLLIEEAYKPTGKGFIQWSDDPDSRVEIFGDTPTIANDIYNSDNPVADGLTKEIPKIFDGTTIDSETTTDTTTDVNENTVTNPDGSTTTTGSHNSSTSDKTEFKLPAFCDYASKLCDWLDWTQEEPELPEEDSDIPSELLPIAFTPFQLVNFDATCPPDIPLELQIIGEPISSVFPMQPFCTFFSGMQPFVLLLSMFVSVRIVAGSLNNTVF